MFQSLRASNLTCPQLFFSRDVAILANLNCSLRVRTKLCWLSTVRITSTIFANQTTMTRVFLPSFLITHCVHTHTHTYTQHKCVFRPWPRQKRSPPNVVSVWTLEHSARGRPGFLSKHTRRMEYTSFQPTGGHQPAGGRGSLCCHCGQNLPTSLPGLHRGSPGFSFRAPVHAERLYAEWWV